MLENIINKDSRTEEEKAHPWRICSIGKHYVREYVAHIPPSKAHPDGITATWHEHCAMNVSHKDELSYHEIQYIDVTYFGALVGPPISGLLTEIFPSADKYDLQIRGWTQYWNDVLKEDILLDANVVKALIGTESSFLKNPPKVRSAHGLMQLTELTFRVLQDPKGELSNYLVRIAWNQLLDPSTNICMGIRWLFQKKKLASIRLGREASWEEAIIEYKGYWDEVDAGEDPEGMQLFRQFYKILQGE